MKVETKYKDDDFGKKLKLNPKSLSESKPKIIINLGLLYCIIKMYLLALKRKGVFGYNQEWRNLDQRETCEQPNTVMFLR